MKKLEDLFNNGKILKVPSYQRAYAWDKTQLEQFISDILEMKEKDYYYGHFILEETNDGFEVIDGQQRLTTFVLFLTVCKLYQSENPSYKFIEQFETVNYDQEIFKAIRHYSINEIKKQTGDFPTLSVKKIFNALRQFIEYFENLNSTNIRLDKSKIDGYIKILTDAHISIHSTKNKAVAVQIFELQNTRGLRLSLIEKVKSKLMKAVYLAETAKTDENIKHIQNKFAEIYKLEEKAQSSSFRGTLSLDEILFNHIRVVDDGMKLFTKDEKVYNQPRMNNSREESILTYLDEKIKNREQVIDYTTKLVDKFAVTVTFLSEELRELDKQNYLIGDVSIFEKSLSYRLFVLIRHKFEEKNTYTSFFKNKELLRIWETLLFTRDFHGKYYNLKGSRDRFELIFLEISQSKEIKDIEDILNKYLNKGFRSDKMDNGNLPETVLKFVSKSKESCILKNAYGWWQFRKMTYVLYKYEREIGADMEDLRKIMKSGQSVEHILPQSWDWNMELINGIGNLLLITPHENSSKNNSHPKEKKYTSCSGGSYYEHNNYTSNKWGNKENWEEIIKERGSKIYDFMITYFQLEKKKPLETIKK